MERTGPGSFVHNEGVDLPAIDTVLMLRPTKSKILFQQQLGRGLRIADGKDSCQALGAVTLAE